MSGRAERVQRGAGLVELMIAITIALVITAGMLVLFQNVRQSFGDQSQLAQLQDRERLAMILLTNVVQQAGYWPSPQSETDAQALPADGRFDVAQGVVGATGAPGTSDTVAVRYKVGTHDGVLDCQGATNQTGAELVHVDTFTVDASGQLTCAIDGQPPVGLVAGVTSMQVLYGLDSDGDGSVDRYAPADAIDAAGAWRNVLAVRVALDFVNPLAAQPGQPATVRFARTIAIEGRT